MQIITSNN